MQKKQTILESQQTNQWWLRHKESGVVVENGVATNVDPVVKGDAVLDDDVEALEAAAKRHTCNETRGRKSCRRHCRTRESGRRQM